MNITRDNFEDCFQTMCEAIRTSHFIALDAEFTGKSMAARHEEELARVYNMLRCFGGVHTIDYYTYRTTLIMGTWGIRKPVHLYIVGLGQAE